MDFLLHVDVHLQALLQQYGGWTYALLFLIVFCETGLVVTPFLPGDSLLFAAGVFAANGALAVWPVVGALTAAAILGDTVNYWVGARLGPRAVEAAHGRWLRREHLERTHRFFERYGGKTIILARFIPIVRTLAPFVAGVGRMAYGRFLLYNVVGGGVWVTLFVGAGYAFHQVPLVQEHFSLVVLAIVVLSVLPAVIEWLRHRARRGLTPEGFPRGRCQGGLAPLAPPRSDPLRSSSMIVVVTGSHGLVGSALVPALEAAGHTVRRLSLRVVGPDPAGSGPLGISSVALSGLGSDPAVAGSDPLRSSLSVLDGADAVVHLAGEPIAAGRWTPAQKAKIRDSRVVGTRGLCEALARLTAPPKVFISASAIGYYGDRGDEVLREDSPPGTGFLPEVGVAWEQAAGCGLGSDPTLGSDPLRVSSALDGIRVVHLRFGIILARQGPASFARRNNPRGAGPASFAGRNETRGAGPASFAGRNETRGAGGALAKMLPPFRLGLGGPLGSGRQWFSWIALDDVVGIIQFALATETLRGPVNVVTPQPVTNAEFTRALGRALRRPAIFPVPAFALRLLLGEMADGLLLASTRVEPAVLTAAGYRFRYPDLESALRTLLR